MKKKFFPSDLQISKKSAANYKISIFTKYDIPKPNRMFGNCVIINFIFNSQNQPT